MSDCLFCKIVSGDLDAEIVYENEDLVAFRDINPQAPTHLLIIPRLHISTLNELTPEHDRVLGAVVRCAGELAKSLGYAEDVYRTVFNCNEAAGQTVFHLHLHLLAGRHLAWPPG